MAIETGVRCQVGRCRKRGHGYGRASSRTEGLGESKREGTERPKEGDSVDGRPIEERYDGRDGDGFANVVGEDETGYREGSKIGGKR